MLKEKIKKIKILVIIKRRIKSLIEYYRDFIFFNKYYLESKENINSIKYDIILNSHSIEKAFLNENPRRFGIKKVEKIIKDLNYLEKYNEKSSYEYNLGLSCLNEYCNLYKERGWTDTNEYDFVVKYIKNKSFEKVDFGCSLLLKEEVIKINNQIDLKRFLELRHSIRKYSNKKLLKEDIEEAIEIAMNTPSACNRQMCKIYYIKDPIKANYTKKYAMGLGNFDLDSINFFIVTFDMNSMYFIGERNQGYFNAGLLSMNFVNALHYKGIGSCFIESGNTFKEEKELKKVLGVPDSERIAVLISAGYYLDKNKVLYSNRKKIDEIYKEL